MLQVGKVIHVTTSNLDSNEICIPIIICGKKGGGWWGIVFDWTGSRQTFLSDEPHWHTLDTCDTETGKAQE